MNTKLHRESAKIYPFPAAGRAPLGGRREGTKPSADLSRVAKATVGSGWYHEAAIQEDAEQARKH
jgi:hypothetical protein